MSILYLDSRNWTGETAVYTVVRQQGKVSHEFDTANFQTIITVCR